MIYPWQIKFSDKEGQKIYISLTISWSKYPYLLYLWKIKVHNDPSLNTSTSDIKNENTAQKVTQTRRQGHLWTEMYNTWHSQ